MIRNRFDLKKYLKEDYKYYKKNLKERIKQFIIQDHLFKIWKYIKYLRYEEYFLNTNKKILYYYYARKKNKLGNELGFYINPNTIEEGLTICHHGSIIVNGAAKIGKNCKLHGNNCIGNNGRNLDSPELGDNVDIGFGAVIIGKVYIADNTRIGANAVVNKSSKKKDTTLVGVPAYEVKK